MQRNVSLDLMEFVERNILKRYNAFDAAHNMTHVNRVINASVRLAQKMGADIDMAYVVAAYHDLGLEVERATHHIESGKILKADRRLDKWFSVQQIEVMRQAVEDHRASASRAPRNIYGKIVAEADRDIQPETVIRRTIQFGLSNYPQLGVEGHWQRFMSHMDEKYSVNGYIRLWIQGSENEKNLQELRTMIAQPTLMRPVFDRIFKEETEEKTKIM